MGRWRGIEIAVRGGGKPEGVMRRVGGCGGEEERGWPDGFVVEEGGLCFQTQPHSAI